MLRELDQRTANRPTCRFHRGETINEIYPVHRLVVRVKSDKVFSGTVLWRLLLFTSRFMRHEPILPKILNCNIIFLLRRDYAVKGHFLRAPYRYIVPFVIERLSNPLTTIESMVPSAQPLYFDYRMQALGNNSKYTAILYY
jgi:hypothetical protein